MKDRFFNSCYSVVDNIFPDRRAQELKLEASVQLRTMWHLQFVIIKRKLKESIKSIGLFGLVGVTMDFLALERLEVLERLLLSIVRSPHNYIPLCESFTTHLLYLFVYSFINLYIANIITWR